MAHKKAKVYRTADEISREKLGVIGCSSEDSAGKGIGMKDLALSFILLTFAITAPFLIVSADAEEAQLPVTARIVTVEQSCALNGTHCDKIKEDVARVLNEMEPAADAATDDVKPEMEMNYE